MLKEMVSPVFDVGLQHGIPHGIKELFEEMLTIVNLRNLMLIDF